MPRLKPCPSLGGGGVGFFAGGDEYRDYCAATDLRLQLRPALLLFGELANDPESQSGSDVLLRRKERLEDLRAQLGRDTFSSVGDRDQHAGTAIAIVHPTRNPDANRAVAGRGVNGVRQEVGEHLSQFTGAAADRRLDAECGFEAQIFVSHLRAIEQQQLVNQLTKLDIGLAGGEAGKSEGVLADLGNAAKFLLGHVKMLADLGREIGIGVGQVEQIADSFQRIVDFVSDGGREPTEGSDFFLGEKSFLCATKLGDIQSGAQQPNAGANTDGANNLANPDGIVADATEAVLDGDGLVAGSGNLVLLQHGRAIRPDECALPMRRRPSRAA